jgi:DNA-binding MarR family transcriptional regulator
MERFHKLFDLVGALARKRYQVGEQHFSTLGLNHTEARLLTLLDQADGRAPQEALSNALNVDRSNAGRALKRLEKDGYVTRRKDETDKRAFVVGITTKGQRIVAEIKKLRKKMAQEFFGDLTDREAATAIELLSKALPTEKT